MERNNQDATNTYNEVAKTVVSFIVDCGCDDADINPMQLALAFEYAYKPLPRFWRDFDLATVIGAVSERFPDWRSAVRTRNQTAEDTLREVEEFLRSNAFDEANAEMLMTLHLSERPMASHVAFDWILAALTEKGLTAEVEYAERDGYDCGTDALLALHRLEHAKQGTVIDRMGRLVALHYRHAAMNHGDNQVVLPRRCS